MRIASFIVLPLALLGACSDDSGAPAPVVRSPPPPPPPSNASVSMQITAGDRHSCLLVPDGTTYCWGANESGQLGNGTQAASLVPVKVQVTSGVPLAGVSSISAGGKHTCAIVNKATTCWGDNTSGQLGDGTLESRSLPGFLNVRTGSVWGVSAGRAHTCIIADDSPVCWGANDFGQVGATTQTRSPYVVPRPATVYVYAGWNVVAAGGTHTCAAAEDGGVYCWGDNASGQLGAALGPTPSPTPVQVKAFDLSTVASGGAHACATTFDSAALVYCWGSNRDGQLGDGTALDRFAPVAVLLPVHPSGLAAGESHTCATSGGALYCWGANSRGQLGDGTRAAHDRPVLVSQPGEVYFSLTAGREHTCAIVRSAGKDTPRCWGANESGQIGDGTTNDALVPTPVHPL